MPRSIQFKPSPEPTIGVEIELQIIDQRTADLVPGAPAILERVPEHEQPFFKSELYRSCLEINTPICHDLDEVREQLVSKLVLLNEIAAPLGYAIVGAGSHPFAVAQRQELTDSDRYRKLVDMLQWTARQFNVFGLHVHVGVDSGEKVIALLNQSVLYLPHLLALSSSSPFWEGEDAGLHSVRSKIFEVLSIAGIPYPFNSWDDFSRLVAHLIDTGSIHTFREIWWDVRPHPDFGTLEWRICDCPSTMNELMALVAVMYTLVVKLSDDFDHGLIHRRPHDSIIRENKWRATRYGVHGQMIDPVSYKSIRIRDAIAMLLDELQLHSARLRAGPCMSTVSDMARSGTSADRQREVYARTGDLQSVVFALRDEFAAQLGND